MAKIPLTIKTTYLPTWGAAEGIRELVQNGRDAEIEHNAMLTVDWHNDVLRIENEGTTLPIKALLLGHTTKFGQSDMIGKFGEGLKLGILALVRAGHAVKIRSGNEVWIPSIERSPVFDEDVLTFDITGGRETKNRVRVEVSGITRDAWDEMKKGFLFISKPKKDEAIETSHGALLLGDRFKGRIFVKGIFVQADPEMSFGYNMKDADLDRDRKMVESYNLRYHTRSIFLDALNKRPDLFGMFDSMLQDATPDIESIDDWSATYVPANATDFIAARFVERHGVDAVPVQSLAESKDIEHFGKKGIIVSRQLGAVLAKKLGSQSAVREKLAKEESARYGWHDLLESEQNAIGTAVSMLSAVENVSLDDIEIVDFRSEGLQGQFKDGKVFIARKILADTDETLAVLVHEVAHRQGLDGDKGHVARIESLWTGIVRNLRKSVTRG